MKQFALLCAVLLATGAVAQDPDPSPTAAPRSAEPIAGGNSRFDHLDVDRDGWLQESEVAVYPQPLPAFAAMDRDGDGKVSSDEWNRRDEGDLVVEEDD